MKISAVPSVTVPTIDAQGAQAPSHVESIRSMRVNTNRTPLSNEQFAPNQVPNGALNESRSEPVVEATQPLSPQLALLAKQRRAIQMRERELANREKALQSQNNPSNAVDIARLKSEPLSVLLENGVTYDQLTEAILSNQGNSEINSLKAEIQSLKQGIDQKFTEKASDERKAVISEMRSEAQRLISQGDEFELVRFHGSTPKAIELIERTYDTTGEILDVPEALRLIEEEHFKDAERLRALKKFQAQQMPQYQPQMPAQQRQQGMRTLTNRDTASVPLSPRARAMAAFYGTLKK